MKKLTILLFLILSSIVNAQEKGLLFLRVFPENAIIRLNDTLLKSQQTYPLDTGNYTLKMWLPTREYVERTVNIKEGKQTQLLEVLSYSDDYKKYQGRQRLYILDKIFLRYVPPVALGYIIYKTISLNNQVTEEYNLSIEAKNNYDAAFNKGQLETYKNEYTAHKSAYDKNVIDYNRSILISGALILTTAALEYLSFKLKKPVYTEKVLLSSLTLSSYNNSIIPSISLTYKFK